MRLRPAHTLVELALVLAVAGVLALLAAPRAHGLLDRLAVRAASAELRGALALARDHALADGRATALHLDTAAGRVAVHHGADTLWSRPLAAIHGITLTATRDSLVYTPLGLGLGGANLSAVIRRGSAVETVRVSREGRVR